MNAPPPEVVEQARWMAWLNELGHILKHEYGMTEGYAWETKDVWREFFDDGYSPKDAAAEDHRAGFN